MLTLSTQIRILSIIARIVTSDRWLHNAISKRLQSPAVYHLMKIYSEADTANGRLLTAEDKKDTYELL